MAGCTLSDERQKPKAEITLSNKDSILIQKRKQELYRQTKAVSVQNHQTSTSGNAQGSSLDRKQKSLQKQSLKIYSKW